MLTRFLCQLDTGTNLTFHLTSFWAQICWPEAYPASELCKFLQIVPFARLVSIWKDEFMKWALSASCFWYFHFFISEKGTHAPFFPKRLLDITSSQKILLLNQFSNNIASGHVTVNLFLNSFNDLTIHSSGLVFFFRSKLIFGNGVGYCSFWSKGVYKPPKLEHFGPRFCPQGPWMTAHMVPRMTADLEWRRTVLSKIWDLIDKKNVGLSLKHPPLKRSHPIKIEEEW